MLPICWGWRRAERRLAAFQGDEERVARDAAISNKTNKKRGQNTISVPIYHYLLSFLVPRPATLVPGLSGTFFFKQLRHLLLDHL